MSALRPNIVLIGMMGSGKSSVGRLVATKLRFQFLDTDVLVVQRSGLEISEIFAQHGEPHFRDLETRALESCAHLQRCVLATGGGVVLREENAAIVRNTGLVVQLTASEEVIWNRVSRNTHRPLLQTEDARATLAKLLEERQPLYDSVAQLKIDTTNANQSEAANAIVAAARKAFGW